MTTNNPLPAPVTPQASHTGAYAFLGLFILLAAGIAAWYFYPHILDTHAAEHASITTRVEQAAAPSDIADRLNTVEQRVAAIESRLASSNTNGTGPAPAEVARIQSDMTALTGAMQVLQTEIKQAGNMAAQSQAAAQSGLASAIAFIQLRDAALSGRSFTQELAAMRTASSKMSEGFQENLAKLDPYAINGAPTEAALREELLTLEAPAALAIDKQSAESWWQRILIELKSLVSIRRAHGGAQDVFTDIENALSTGDADTALQVVHKLPPEAQTVLKDWQAKLQARGAIDDAIRSLAASFAITSDKAAP